MRERPIIFSGDMVRAILDGRKTMTRRILRARHVPDEHLGELLRIQDGYPDGVPRAVFSVGDEVAGIRSPYGAPGDRLWVRECHAFAEPEIDWRPGTADPVAGNIERVRSVPTTMAARGHVIVHYGADDGAPAGLRWRSPIHMPRWASRLVLDVLAVRVERLQDITEDDARAEGFERREHLIRAWDGMHGAGSFDSVNPWCWCITFRRAEAA